MRIVSTSYINTSSFNDPAAWLERINFCTGTLEKLATKHEVYSIEQIQYEGIVEQNNVTYYFLNFGNKKLYFPFALHRYIKKLQPDVVLVHGLIFPLQVMQLRRILGSKTLIFVQHHGEKPYAGIRRWLQRQADKMIDRYLFTSAEMGIEWVQKGIISGESKIEEVMEASSPFHATNKQDALQQTGISGQPLFLWVGRLNANKDPLTVVKAFKKFLEDQPAASLFMIFHEDDLLNEVKGLVTETKNIKLVGKIAHSELQNWYNAADFIISGSYHEGSGLAVCEAMSCGCVPLLTDIPSFRKMTGRGRCGLLYGPGNEEQLLSVLKQTLQMDREIEKEKTLQQFQEFLSFEAIAKKINALIAK